MTRSAWKGPHYSASPNNNRSSEILPEYIGKKFLVHNGKKLIPFIVSSKHVGHKFGEFVFTKTPAIYKKGK